MNRIGHKGADAVVPGNTIDSFRAAVELGVDMIEVDVLRLRGGELVIAHDYRDAERRRPMSLTECLDAFAAPPFDGIELDCDLKLPGGEPELAAALRERDLLDRAMVSTMELSSLRALRRLDPGLRLGWTYPKVTRDWTGRRWARPAVAAALRVMRARLPRIAARALPGLEVQAMWVYWPLVGRRLLDVARPAGVAVNAWTVDDPARIRALRRLGVDGICTNDPRFFAELDRALG